MSLAFRSSTCAIEFFLLFNYRILILACFLTPLLLMGGLYIRIFYLIKKHEVERSILSAVPSLDASHASPKTTPHVKQVDNKSAIPIKNCRNMNNNHQCNWIRSVLKSPGGNGKNPVTNEVIFEVSNNESNESNKNSNKRSNGRMSQSVPCVSHVSSEPEEVHRQEMDHLEVTLASTSEESFRSKSRHISVHISSSSANTHWKALSTTLIVLGTYLVCWMPAVCFLALTCIDGCPFPLGQMSSSSRLIIGFVCNSLVILKAIVDPFIYTLRMADVKVALKKFVGIDRRNRQKSARSFALSRSLTSRNSN